MPYLRTANNKKRYEPFLNRKILVSLTIILLTFTVEIKTAEENNISQQISPTIYAENTQTTDVRQTIMQNSPLFALSIQTGVGFFENGIQGNNSGPKVVVQTLEAKENYGFIIKNTNEEIKEKIRIASEKHNVNFVEMYETIRCESRFRQSAVGKAGEIGIAQFMPKTFIYFSDLFDFTGNINNADDQIELMAIAFSKKLQYHWTCWRNLFQ